MLFRKRFIDNLPNWYFKTLVGDIPLKLILLHQGMAIYIDEVMSVYRENVINAATYKLSHNFTQQLKYHNSMIKMLGSFNEYTYFKYANEIVERQIINEIQILKFENIISRFQIFKKAKYKNCMQKLSLKKKFKLYFICCFPRICKKINIFRSTKSIKNFLFRKTISNPEKLKITK